MTPRARPSPAEAAVAGLLLLTVALIAAQVTLLAGDARLFSLAASSLSLMLGLWRPRAAVALALVGALAAAAGAMVLVYAPGAGPDGGLVSATSIAALGAAALAAGHLLRGAHHHQQELRRLVNALTPTDAASEALRTPFGLDRLRGEVARASRYSRTFSVLLGKPRRWNEEVENRGEQAVTASYARLVRAATRTVRPPDCVALVPGQSFLVVLPETGFQGAELAAKRIQMAVDPGLDLKLQFGVAQFPEDGVTAEALLEEARQAQAFAAAADLAVASRRLLSSQQPPE